MAWRTKLALGAAAALAGAVSPPMQQTTPAPQPTPTPYVKDPRYWPAPVMDSRPPTLPSPHHRRAVLIFSKTNGFRDDPQIKAADAALANIVTGLGRDIFVTENAAVFNPAQLHFTASWHS